MLLEGLVLGRGLAPDLSVGVAQLTLVFPGLNEPPVPSPQVAVVVAVKPVSSQSSSLPAHLHSVSGEVPSQEMGQGGLSCCPDLSV